MTTIEKAKQLVSIFESIAHPTIDCDKQFATEAAIICVNELISAFRSSACRDVHIEYWIEVEREIERNAIWGELLERRNEQMKKFNLCSRCHPSHPADPNCHICGIK